MRELRIAVHLHLYYRAQLAEFLEKLRSLDTGSFDLFVTLVQHDDATEQKILAQYPDAHLKVVENRGYDIGPFIDFLNDINLDGYDYILKLHTKGRSWKDRTKTDRYWIRNNDWARLLADSLLMSAEVVQYNLEVFARDPAVMMIGSGICMCSSPLHYARLLPQINRVMQSIGLGNVSSCAFIGGSMFMARASIFKPLQRKYYLTDFEPSDGMIKEGLFAHVIERVFGILAHQNGGKICGYDPDALMCMRLWLTNLYISIRRFVVSSDRSQTGFTLKIFSVPVYTSRK